MTNTKKRGGQLGNKGGGRPELTKEVRAKRMIVANEIKFYRIAMRLSTYKAAAIMNVRQSTLNNLEAGTVREAPKSIIFRGKYGFTPRTIEEVIEVINEEIELKKHRWVSDKKKEVLWLQGYKAYLESL